MGLRGPQPISSAALKANAVQWAYLLHGLHDGQPEQNEKITWSDRAWEWGISERMSVGRIVRIVFARIVFEQQMEKVHRLFEIIHVAAACDEETGQRLPGTLSLERVEKQSSIPTRSQLGMAGDQSYYLAFLPLQKRRDLWDSLLRMRSKNEMQRVAKQIADWIPPIPAYQPFREALHRHGTELPRAKKLWVYPDSKKRPTSEGKRVDFFAKALGGLMLGLAPATAQRRLLRWKLPELWITDYEKEGEK